MIEITIDAVRKRVPVIAGTGSNSTAEALRLTRHAWEAGADAALMVCPYYNRPTQEGLYHHYRTIAEEVPIPIIIYNIASRTGVNMLPETLARLAKIPNIVGVKEASGSLKQMSDVIQLCGPDFAVLSGRRHLYPGASGHRRQRGHLRHLQRRARRHGGNGRCLCGRRSGEGARPPLPDEPPDRRPLHRNESHPGKGRAFA